MKNKNQDWRDLNLADDEAEMLESIEKGEWKSVGNIEERRQRLREFFAGESDDMSNININLSKEEYEYLIQKSSQYGISYKELIGKLIHSYTSGKVEIDILVSSRNKDRRRRNVEFDSELSVTVISPKGTSQLKKYDIPAYERRIGKDALSKLDVGLSKIENLRKKIENVKLEPKSEENISTNEEKSKLLHKMMD